MAFVVPNEGEAQMLNLILGKTATENLTLKLFTNNVTPAETDNAATYTEAAGNGYAAISLVAADWTVTAGTGAPGTTTAVTANKVFTLTGVGSYYGYYIVGATSGKLYLAEAFGAVKTFDAGGGTITIPATMNLD